MQGEHSFSMEMYTDLMHSILLNLLDKMDEHEKLAIWLQTDNGFDWKYDNDDKQDSASVYSHEDIADYIMHEYIYKLANNASNKRIRAYLDSCCGG